MALPEEGAEIEGAALFLLPEGERHKAAERRLEVGPVPVAKLLAAPLERAFAFSNPAPPGARRPGRPRSSAPTSSPGPCSCAPPISAAPSG